MDVTILRRWDDPATGKIHLTASNVQREQTFAVDVFTEPLAEAGYLTCDGERIVLNVDNGRWVWKVTRIDEQRGLVYGVMPD